MPLPIAAVYGIVISAAPAWSESASYGTGPPPESSPVAHPAAAATNRSLLPSETLRELQTGNGAAPSGNTPPQRAGQWQSAAADRRRHPAE